VAASTYIKTQAEQHRVVLEHVTARGMASDKGRAYGLGKEAQTLVVDDASRLMQLVALLDKREVAQVHGYIIVCTHTSERKC